MLIKVVNKETGNSASMNLEETMTLTQVRCKLMKQNLMNQETMFLNDGSCVFQEDEDTLYLAELLAGGKEIFVGIHGEISCWLEATDFSGLSNDMILDFFEKKQLCRGLVFSSRRGVTKSYSDTFRLTNIPQMLAEAQNTYFHSYYAFSKESCDLSLITSSKTSLSLNTPFADASVEFSQKLSEKSHAEKVTEYMLSKLVVSLMSFRIDPASCLPTKEFVTKMHEIVAQKIEKERKALLILQVLDDFGLYIPLEFTMGGAMYATETTQITEYSTATAKESDFSSRADAAFNGYSGGFSFDSGTQSGVEESESSKYQIIEVKQIGGEPGNTNNKEIFLSSLQKLAKWEIVDIREFYPSVLLLTKAHQIEGVDPLLFIKVKNLLTDFSMHQFLLEHQPYINMTQYINMLSSWISIK